MKTFRLIGLVLFTIIMSVKLSSCSKDNEDLNTNIKEKKLVQAKQLSLNSEENSSTTFDFCYDSKDRLISVTHTYSSSDIRITNYMWGNNIIVEQTEDSNMIFNLENNLVKTIQQ